MSLRTALDRLIAIQAGLTIADPAAVAVKRAYKYNPPASVQLPDLPAFLNEWTMLPVEAGASMRTRRFLVEMSCAVALVGPEDDRSADVATALFEALLDAWGADITLARTVTLSNLRGGEPTIGVIQRGGLLYIGFTAVLDLQITDAFTWS
jgi:hypothetical protein